MFSANLDFLMNLTGTQSSTLARACLVSASHVSRLRSGARNLPKNPTFLKDMSLFFARHMQADYQKNVMCAKLGLSSWPDGEEQAAELLFGWLSSDREVLPNIAPLLTNFAGAAQESFLPGKEKPLGKPKNYYYGASGKQEAVLQFFDLVLKQKKPCILLLSSDEEMGWLYENPEFAVKWSLDFQKVLRAGNRVKIVHSIGRNMNEMLEGVAKWIPLYTSGLIEPYYYPRLRDGVFHRTLFLAPGTAAVISTSISTKTDGMLNELITDRHALSALKLEFEQYLSLCRPLMHIFTLPKRSELWQVWDTLLRSDSPILCMSDLPTLATMPREVALSMQERAPRSRILRQWTILSELIGSLPEHLYYTEILPTMEELARCPIPPLPCADLLDAPGLCYTPSEWQAHLESTRHFAASHRSYRQVLRRGINKNVCLFAKEQCGVLMVKGDAPGIAFAFSEPNMVNSFWDYLSRK